MIMFTEIYSKAIHLFQDPKIQQAYLTNTIQFCKLMYPFLNTSAGLFTNPSFVATELSVVAKPNGKMEVFKADNVNKVFTLSIVPIPGSIFQYKENGNIVDGVYNEEDNTVTFPDILENGQYSCEVYFPGEFLSDFQNVFIDKIRDNAIEQIRDILARLLIISWAENTRNFLLDIQNILTTSDFKLHPASTALNSKDAWITTLNCENAQLQNKLSLTIRFAKNSNWGMRTW